MHFNIKNLLLETEEWNKNDVSSYKKIYNSFKDLIVNKSIPNHTKLPPSRVLAKDIGVSRSTVIKAFDLLCFERFVIAKKGSGYYINYEEENTIQKKTKSEKLTYPKTSKRVKLFQKHKYINTDNFSKTNVAFRPGLPPLDLFPFDKWKNLSNIYWRKATPTDLSYAPSEGLESLRICIMNYLRLYRNLKCNYKQIIITSGSLHSLYLIGNTLINTNDEIIMENPTFPRAYNLFKSIKANIISCPVDKEGINIESIQSDAPKFIYATPSNQYPLGIKMSLERREELLAWTSKRNSLIIEDDYDHEFSNWEKPIQSLFSLDKENRVIYIGTFNKLLHPSLRIGYMIAPEYLVEPIKSIYEQSSRFIPSHTQEILTNFMSKDYLNKHIRNVIEISKIRKQLFIQHTENVLDIEHHFEGLHIIGKIKNNSKDKKIHKELLKNNVVAYPLSNYYIEKEKKMGLVLGFASVNEKTIREKTLRIKKVLTTN